MDNSEHNRDATTQMSTPVFITFKDSLINVNDIACAKVCSNLTYDNDLAWEIVIYFNTGSTYTTYKFDTKTEAQNAHKFLQQLVREALTGYSFDGKRRK